MLLHIVRDRGNLTETLGEKYLEKHILFWICANHL